MDKREQLKKAEEIIEQIYKNTDVVDPFLLKSDPLHSKTCRDWVLRLRPNASVALQIAALGHDIDRAFVKRAIYQSDYPADQYAKYKMDHARNCAKILEEYLAPAGIDKDTLGRVKYLVEHHEIGGDDEAEILKTADSLTFFTVSMPLYYEDRGAEKTKKKIIFMYARLSDEERVLVDGLEFKDPALAELFRQAKAEIVY